MVCLVEHLNVNTRFGLSFASMTFFLAWCIQKSLIFDTANTDLETIYTIFPHNFKAYVYLYVISKLSWFYFFVFTYGTLYFNISPIYVTYPFVTYIYIYIYIYIYDILKYFIDIYLYDNNNLYIFMLIIFSTLILI